MLRENVKEKEEIIRQNVEVLLKQNQFDALISFIFTLSDVTFKNSDLLKFLNSSSFSWVTDEMKKFTYSNKTFAPGLVPRRDDEAQLFSR